MPFIINMIWILD